MRFASLGSGSRGNALVVECGSTRVLVDAGFGPREMARRLARLGLDAADIQAVLVTHEHADHCGGVSACARRYGWRTYLTHGTLVASRLYAEGIEVTVVDSHEAFAIGDLAIRPFPVPHDAREPIQFVLGDGARRLGVLTDAGHVTRHAANMLDGCDALFLECNHDLDLLERGSYPRALKQRIAGAWGHLDNGAAASLLEAIDRSRLKHVVAAHLSEENNRPSLACGALATVLACEAESVDVALQDDGLAWRSL